MKLNDCGTLILFISLVSFSHQAILIRDNEIIIDQESTSEATINNLDTVSEVTNNVIEDDELDNNINPTLHQKRERIRTNRVNPRLTPIILGEFPSFLPIK